MTKSETLQQLAAASNAARLAELGKQIETVRQAKLESAEQLATVLEPLAQAMAALTDDTRESLVAINKQSQEQAEKFQAQIDAASRAWREAAACAQRAADSLNRAGQRIELTHYLLTFAMGILSAILVTVFWRWLAPPEVINQMDPRAVAELLKPEIAAVKRSKGK